MPIADALRDPRPCPVLGRAALTQPWLQLDGGLAAVTRRAGAKRRSRASGLTEGGEAVVCRCSSEKSQASAISARSKRDVPMKIRGRGKTGERRTKLAQR